MIEQNLAFAIGLFLGSLMMGILWAIEYWNRPSKRWKRGAPVDQFETWRRWHQEQNVDPSAVDTAPTITTKDSNNL